jgi:signal transduction histidine kinase
LPRVTADRASLAQAVLNLLASAIDQTPVGGAVVISAQRHDDGSIAIQVRDGSAHAVDMAERFVVFRDGVGRSGQMLAPVRSSVGLALTRSLLAVNAVSLAVDPAGPEGMLFTLRIPADLVDDRPVAQEAE